MVCKVHLLTGPARLYGQTPRTATAADSWIELWRIEPTLGSRGGESHQRVTQHHFHIKHARLNQLDLWSRLLEIRAWSPMNMSKALWRGTITNVTMSFSKYTERNRNDSV